MTPTPETYRRDNPHHSSSTLDDRDIVARMRALTSKLRGYAIGLLGSSTDADDLVQDALLRAWRSRHTYTLDTNFKAWMFRILHNRFISVISERRPLQDTDGWFAARLSEPPSQEFPLQYAEIMAGLQKLSAPAREVLVLASNGESYEEIAEICGCRMGTVKSRVSRARSRLLEILETELTAVGGSHRNAFSTDPSMASAPRSPREHASHSPA